MKAATIAARVSADAEKQLQSLIDKFEPKHQTLIRAVRNALRKRLPTANELAYDNYNIRSVSAKQRPRRRSAK